MESDYPQGMSEQDAIIYDLFVQSCYHYDTQMFHHNYVSAYEDSQEYLLKKGLIKAEDCAHPVMQQGRATYPIAHEEPKQGQG